MKFNNTYGIGILISVTLTLALHGSAQRPAVAAGTVSSACSTDLGFASKAPGQWAFSVDFGDGSVDGCLLVTGENATKITAHPIACENFGAVTVVNGAGVFNGQNYLKCAVDLKAYLPGIPNVAVYGSGFQMTAQLSGVGVAANTLSNALIHHSSISYFAPRETFGLQRITSRLNGVSYSSALGLASNFWMRSHAACAPACSVHHSLNGGLIASQGIAGPVQVDTTDSTFLIGHSPLPGASKLVGTLGFIVIDPPGPKPPGGSGT